MAILLKCSPFYKTKEKKRFVCVGNSGESYYSDDGETWIRMTGLNEKVNYYAVFYFCGKFICGGLTGRYSYSYYDEDNWHIDGNSGLGGSYLDYARGKNHLLAITSGSGNVGVSKNNGSTWESDRTSNQYGDRIIYISASAIVYAKNRFVMIGDKSECYYTLEKDYPKWSKGSGLDISLYYYDITYGNGKFVCVGSKGSSYYSIYGITWVKMSGLDTTVTFSVITYGNGKFVTIGNGMVYHSTDGENWTKVADLADTTYINSLTYGNGKFVCVGYSGTSYSSIDGINWTRMTGLNNKINYNSVCYSIDGGYDNT